VFVGWSAGLAAAWFAEGGDWILRAKLLDWQYIAPAIVAVFLLGVVDDLRGLGWRSKFAVQVGAALGIWFAGFRIQVLSHPLGDDPIALGMWSLPVTLLWIVGITNAMNLIDGLDGLAAGTAMIATVAVAVIAVYEGHRSVVVAAVVMVGSLAGFLVFNFNPARIFLGDSGSMLLGFVLAVISIQGSQKGSTAVAVLAPMLVLGLPILDTSLTVARRLLRIGFRDDPGDSGRLMYVASNAHRLFLPDQGHIHHRLLRIGLSHRGAVLLLYVVVVVLALAALAVVIVNDLVLAGLLVATLAMLVAGFVVAVVLRRNRWASEERHAQKAADEQKPSSRPVGLHESGWSESVPVRKR
jgi:UDP-GlcNAc:undecaprenyl-phosphate GlcNAc-1-phosphate transferase